MKLLLDTHVFLWMAAEPDRLSDKAKKFILDYENELYVSIVSLWEMQIKKQLGKLSLDIPIDELWHKQQVQSDLLLLFIKEDHVWKLGKLPQIHRDPFDRLLICQALNEDMVLISADNTFNKYEVNIIW